MNSMKPLNFEVPENRDYTLIIFAFTYLLNELIDANVLS